MSSPGFLPGDSASPFECVVQARAFGLDEGGGAATILHNDDMTTDQFRIRGGCLCGGVRYELRAPFRRANFCHCSRCRKHSGAAALAQGRVPASAFTVLQGRDLLVSFTEPGHMAKVFCGRCGSSLFGGTWPDGPEVSVRLGTLDDDLAIRPSYHSYVQDVPAWDQLSDDGLPRYSQRPPRDVS